MIWNAEVLFLHVPKTGGMSISDYLIRRLRGPVHYTAPEPDPSLPRGIHHRGRRHETLADAAAYLSSSGIDIEDFKLILATMRNPYELEVSRYHYLRLANEWDQGTPQRIALENSFPEYLAQAGFFGSGPPRFERYYELAGRIPPNMRILRFENLETDFLRHVNPFLRHSNREHRLPETNTTDHGDYRDYYDESAEAICHDRHRWIFDRGYFPRLGRSGSVSRCRNAATGGPRGTGLATPAVRVPIEIGLRSRRWPREAARFDDYIATFLQRRDLSGMRVLNIEALLDLALPAAQDLLGLADFVGIEPDELVYDWLESTLSGDKMSFINGSVGDTDKSVQAADVRPAGTPGFDLVLARTPPHLQTLPRLEELLRLAHEVTAEGGRLIFSATVASPTVKPSSVNILLERGLSCGADETAEFDWELGTITVYGADFLSSMLERYGWRVDAAREPEHSFSHHFACTRLIDRSI